MSSMPLGLLVAELRTTRPERPGPEERDRLIRCARSLSWLSLGYMTAEGAIAIIAAILAGSVALLGFGLDSVIEALASVIVIWRFTGSRRLSEDAERRAERLVAVTFFLLAPYIAQDAIRALIVGEHPHTSWLGIGLSIASIVVMPLLGQAKQRIGQRLGSGATAGEGAQNLVCAYLAAGVLASLVLNVALGWWWVDPAVALGIAGLAIKEGREAWAGDGCACAAVPGLDGETCEDDDCCPHDDLRSVTGELVIAACRLDLKELEVQRDRYRRLGAAADRVIRAPLTLTVEFTAAVDCELVEQTLAVERDCCPFFALSYDAAARRLTGSVAEPGQDRALDALVAALDADGAGAHHRS